MTEKDKILGTGWAFPPTFEKTTNTVKLLSGIKDVQSSIKLIIKTKLGERIMRNEFGSSIYDLLFEPLNQNTKTYMQSSLKRALTYNEPRIEIQKITLTQNNQGLGRIDIEIEYILIEINESANLVVPFYTPDNISLT